MLRWPFGAGRRQGVMLMENFNQSNIGPLPGLNDLTMYDVFCFLFINPCIKCYNLFKGLILDMCVLLISTPEWVVSPRRVRQPTRDLISTTHTYPGLIPIITWCWQFPSLSANILLIKSKLKLESRASVVGVAMSPHNIRGKYRGRPHPRWRMCLRQFFFSAERVSWTVSEWCHRLATTSSIMWCDSRLNFCGTLSSPTKMASSTHTIYIHSWTGRYVF